MAVEVRQKPKHLKTLSESGTTGVNEDTRLLPTTARNLRLSTIDVRGGLAAILPSIIKNELLLAPFTDKQI
jgi:hypothetical protein